MKRQLSVVGLIFFIVLVGCSISRAASDLLNRQEITNPAEDEIDSVFERSFGWNATPGSTIACNEDPPEGAPQANELPVYEGTCPMLIPAPDENTILSSGHDRGFMLAVPSNLSPDEKLPVIFMWHWLGGSARSFYTRGEVQAAVDSQRFLAVLPNHRGDLPFRWPFLVLDSQARMNEEYHFFEDMLALRDHRP